MSAKDHLAMRPRALRRVTALLAIGVVTMAGVARAQSNFSVRYAFSPSGPLDPAGPLIQATDGNFYGMSATDGASVGRTVFHGGTVFQMTPAGTVVVLHTFDGSTDGRLRDLTSSAVLADSALIQATDGNLYGMTPSGGLFGQGTIFRITLTGSYTVLHSFAGAEGAFPKGSLIQATDGNLYGATSRGGTSGAGTVFQMTPTGTVTVLYSFQSADGVSPETSLVQATDGNFYGLGGGPSKAFKITPAGVFTVLHTFLGGSVYGLIPTSALTQATDGNLYGTTRFGGASNGGTVYKMTLDGTVTVLHSFAHETFPPSASALIQATDGNLYGTNFNSAFAGSSVGGTAFRLSLGGTFTVLHSFDSAAEGRPFGALFQATNGDLYGVAKSLDLLLNSAPGRVFRMTPSGIVTVLHRFSGGNADGYTPTARLVQAADGNFYGTASVGGSLNQGTVFAMTPSGTLTVSHAFDGVNTGATPNAGLIQGTDGNFYGTSSRGGTADHGTVFQMTPTGTVTAQSLSNAGFPLAAVIQATDGNFYGTTAGGDASSNKGTVFKMTAAGIVTVLHVFNFEEGAFPQASLIQATDGNFYGTLSTRVSGGCCGAVFRMTAAGTVTIVHVFSGTDGATPTGALLQTPDGNLYGTAYGGGYGCARTGGCGTIFKISFAAPGGSFTVLHTFDGGSKDGAHPYAGLIRASDGNFYGTTTAGGAFDLGTVFQMTPEGTITLLHSFTGPDGSFPAAALMQGTDGQLYGTAAHAGPGGSGVVFRYALGSPARPTLTATAGAAYVQLMWSAAAGATSYTVKRGLTSGAETPLATGVTATSYRDTTVAAGVTYYYVVSAVNAAGESLNSNEVVSPARRGDFDGDGMTDVAVYRRSTGQWWVLQSSRNNATSVSYSWGASTDMTVPADYDGDGKMDIAVYRPTTGEWWVLQSSSNYTTFVNYRWGVSTDIPVPGDYDGDRRADVAIYRPATGAWFILQSSADYTTFFSHTWGVSTDIPVPADYDGDGRTDIAVYRPSTGEWWVLQSSSNYTTFVNYRWGVSTDIPVPGDYDGDSKTDPAIYRPSTGDWWILLSSVNYTTYFSRTWGVSTDIPVPADYDGDGKTDIAIYRPSTSEWWAVQARANFTAFLALSFGVSTDIPIPKRP
jgi:uncharacterized repeat protein (TIGR03803 family)